ncbi:MAG: radical SAM protein [Promethearchaeota archaeon]
MVREYTFGPFQSRRLKLSLGVDVLPKQKKCTYDCVYCEIGCTLKGSLVSPDYRIKSGSSHRFRRELKDILKFVPHLNSITFGYNGEPTLNENLLDFRKVAYEVRDEMKWDQEKPLLTLFTNSSTLYSKEIRERVKQFDLVLAKLDAATEDDFKRTNAPHKDTPDIEEIINSIAKLRKEMPKENKLAIQCLVYNSYRDDFIPNSNPQNIEKLAYAIKKIKPHLVQVYSIARIPAQYYVFAIDEKQKQQIVKKFKDIINDDSVDVYSY